MMMPRVWKLGLVLIAGWLLSGVFIVGGNERAAVRRFGRAVRETDGTIDLKPSGLHYDWPWPFSQVDRVNLKEVRTVYVPAQSEQPMDENQLLGDGFAIEPAFLTGDKNLLMIRLAVQYRVNEAEVGGFLYGSRDPEKRLICLTEAVATRLLSESGVDYVQVSGLSEWRLKLTELVQTLADRQALGVIIENISLEDVAPPVQVKADFLDVANARAEREQFLQQAYATADGLRRSAQSEAQEIRGSARSEAREIVLDAHGSAARFAKLIEPFEANAETANTAEQTLARRLALERHYYSAIAEILENVQGQVFLDTGRPVDLTILKSLPATNEKSPESDPIVEDPGVKK